MYFRKVRLVLQVLLVRLRFPALLLGAVLLVGIWPWLRGQWDRLTRLDSGIDTSISLDTEYWCPMCPGVLSKWPGKCPVCFMALVRRQKGEATPLPDGVIARMQLSPYRVQLAGIHTTPTQFLPLAWETTASGLIEGSATPGHVRLVMELAKNDAALLQTGLRVEMQCEDFPDRAFIAHVAVPPEQVESAARLMRMSFEIEDPSGDLRPDLLVTMRLHVPLNHLDELAGRVRYARWASASAEIALGVFAFVTGPRLTGPIIAAAQSLPGSIARYVQRQRGLTLAVPTSAVMDTGDQKVVFVERMPGMFDGVEVGLGRRCGEYYPILSGLQPGDRVATAGAFLLDAETRLNPSMAASYFGAAGRSKLTVDGPGAPQQESLTEEDQRLIAEQKVCPVTGAPLGSMGQPVRVVIAGKPVFLCCKGCEAELRRDPKKYLANPHKQSAGIRADDEVTPK